MQRDVKLESEESLLVGAYRGGIVILVSCPSILTRYCLEQLHSRRTARPVKEVAGNLGRDRHIARASGQLQRDSQVRVRPDGFDGGGVPRVHDGVDHHVGTAGGHVYVLDDAGHTRWDRATGGSINALAVCDLDGSGRATILAGGDDSQVHALSADGQPNRLPWRVHVELGVRNEKGQVVTFVTDARLHMEEPFDGRPDRVQ